MSNPYLRGVIEYYFEKDEKFIRTLKDTPQQRVYTTDLPEDSWSTH